VFLAIGHLPIVSHQSHLSDNVKDDNETFTLQLRKSPENLSHETIDESCRPVIDSNGVPYFKMRSVRSFSTSGREKVKNKERTG